MATQPAPEDRLAAAVCLVLLTVSERNLRHGGTHTVQIPRSRLHDLEQALEAGWPGYLTAQRALAAEREQHRADLKATKEGR
jgi:hypothetical protein